MAVTPNSGRDSFTSGFGIIAATAGSAIGLGNIWRFPYIAGENGGGAFLVVYLFCIALIGTPVMMSEFLIGRGAQKNAVGSFKSLAPRRPWFLVGIQGVVSAFIILAFYAVVAGWTLGYMIESLRWLIFPGKFGFGEMSTAELTDYFTGSYAAFLKGTWKPVILFIVMMAVTAWIVISGIREGIEKYTKILMPLLLVLLTVLVIRSVTLEGAREGVAFLFNPDFSQLTPANIVEALGHAFFSLSVGMGTLITYGSYIPKKENLTTTAVSVAVADTFVAVVAGLAIFPAVFAFGISPDSGPGLVYITIPAIFQQLPIGAFWAMLFFLLLCLAALTSTISVLEVVVAYFAEELGLHRRKATYLAAFSIGLLGLLCTLSWGPLSGFKIGGNNIFDLFNGSPSFLLTFGGFFIVVFVGWFYARDKRRAEMSSGGRYRIRLYPLFVFLVRFVVPLGIALVFLNAIGLIRF